MSGGGSGGGGSSGKTDYPGYIKRMHNYWGTGTDNFGFWTGLKTTDVSLDDALSEAWDNNPWLELASFDPSDILASLRSRLGSFQSIIDAIAEETDWESFAATARDEYDDNVADEDHIDEAVEEFEDRQKLALNRAVSQYNAAMFDAGAVMTSAHVIGRSLIYMEHLGEIARFNAALTVEKFKDRTTFITNGVQQISALLAQRLSNQSVAANLDSNISAIEIQSQSQFNENEEDLVGKAASWRVDLIEAAGNFLASITGGTTSKWKQLGGSGKQKGGLQGGVSGLIGGAASGAAIGSIVPGLGTVTGALIGGGLGGAAGAA